jgi:hypothetical protein
MTSNPSVGQLGGQHFEGQLNKFTNVVKGWQYRWFVLTPETGQLDYYLMDEGVIGKRRGRQHVAGTLVIPSEEDSQTFHVNFASGESYKLRAANVRERQVWVDRIRAVAQRHDSALARDNAPPIAHKEYMGPPPGAKSLLSSNGEPSVALQHLSLSVLDAFGSVHDILQQTDLKHANLAKTIETLSSTSTSLPRCHDDELLVLKATSQAALQSMEAALNILQDLRDLQLNNITKVAAKPLSSPMAVSPKKMPGRSFFHHHNSHQDLRMDSPDLSACGSPTRLELNQDLHGGLQTLDTLSVKSAAIMSSTAAASDLNSPSSAAMSAGAGKLSASTSHIDQASSDKAS